MRKLMLMLGFVLCLPMWAQDKEWMPTGVWPFVNKKFHVATVYNGYFKLSKTRVPCNIHVGNQTLWYVQNDTLMEAIPGSILRVEFPDSVVYVPAGNNHFARIVHEDSVGRVLCSPVVNYDELYRDEKSRNLNAFTLDGAGLFPAMTIDMIGSYVPNPEEQPLPMTNEFYFVYDKEIFPVTEKNILAHIQKERRGEYKAFTRSAEIILKNESSVMKIWKEFFLNRTPKKRK
jgi:hypothetical protein